MCATESRVPKLRVITPDEVSEHDGIGDSTVWVSYKGHVYDLTKFIEQHKHPGGRDNILMAAGGDVGPFFEYWAQHLKSSKTEAILNQCLIGELPRALAENEPNDPHIRDPYDAQPRHPGLVVPPNNPEARPFCAEPERLPEQYYTPAELFFVRNHAPVPELNPTTHSFSLDTQVLSLVNSDHYSYPVRTNISPTHASILLADLRAGKYGPEVIVDAAFQCTANRLDEMARGGFGTAFGDAGAPSAGGKNWIGNARY
jgi:cytochrome b involved in lipid metabolism